MTGPPQPSRPLTMREAMVARCVAKGQRYKRIGQSLGISEHTAEFHVRRIAALLPKLSPEEDELDPYQRVLVYAYWRYRADPSPGQSLA